MLVWLAAGTAAVPDAVKTKSGLPQFNVPDMAPQLIWLALTFGLMYLVLSRITLPRIASVIEERKARIGKDLEEARLLKAETDRAIAAYEQERAEAHGRASSIVRDMLERLAAETNEERAKAETEIAETIAAAQERIAAAKSQAMKQVNTIATDTAGEIVRKFIGVDVSQAEINIAVAMQIPDGD